MVWYILSTLIIKLSEESITNKVLKVTSGKRLKTSGRMLLSRRMDLVLVLHVRSIHFSMKSFEVVDWKILPGSLLVREGHRICLAVHFSLVFRE